MADPDDGSHDVNHPQENRDQIPKHIHEEPIRSPDG
jgi:hypothetical protein